MKEAAPKPTVSSQPQPTLDLWSHVMDLIIVCWDFPACRSQIQWMGGGVLRS